MRVVAVSMVRNERDIVEAFVRHNAAFVDAHLVLDNGSTDDTTSILASLVAEGLDLVVEHDPRPGYYQSERTTPLMRRAVNEFDADWVIPIDADEFIVAGSRRALRKELSEHDRAVLWPMLPYAPHPEDDPSEVNPVRRITHRVVEDPPRASKVLVPKRLAASATLLQGNHDMAEEGDRAGASLRQAALAHFPVRSPQQLAVKVAVSTLQYQVRGERYDWGHHYHEPYALLAEGWEAFMAGYHEQAARFGMRQGEEMRGPLIEDPISYAGGRLRHTTGMRSDEPFRSILEYASTLADRYSALRMQAPSVADTIET